MFLIFLKIKGLIPEYNDKYDSKFEPQVNITTCEADSNAEASSDNRTPCCSHKCEDKPHVEERTKSQQPTVWPRQLEQEQSQNYSSDTSIESQAKRIKEEPVFEQTPIIKKAMDKNKRKRTPDNYPHPSMSYEHPPRPQSNNSMHERPRDNYDYYVPEYNIPDDYLRIKEQSSSKGQKKNVRQGKFENIFI